MQQVLAGFEYLRTFYEKRIRCVAHCQVYSPFCCQRTEQSTAGTLVWMKKLAGPLRTVCMSSLQPHFQVLFTTLQQPSHVPS